MKRILALFSLILLILTLFSCSNDSLENVDSKTSKTNETEGTENEEDSINVIPLVGSDDPATLLKAVVYNDDYGRLDLLEQLASQQIAVNFVQMGNVNDSKHLSAKKEKHDGMMLFWGDDNSGHQRFYIEKSPFGKGTYYMRSEIGGGKKRSIHLWAINGDYEGIPWRFSTRQQNYWYWTFFPVPETNNYIISLGGRYLLQDNTPVIAATSYDSRDIYLLKNSETSRKYWEIQPVEKYELIDGFDIKYTLAPDDLVEMIPHNTSKMTSTNTGSTPTEQTVALQQTIGKSSSYSKTHGMTVTIKSTFSVNAAVFSTSGEVSTNYNESTQYANTENSSTTITNSIKVITPPNKRSKVTMSTISYKATVSYKVKARGEITGRIIYLTGKWKGISIGETNYTVEELNADGTPTGRTKQVKGNLNQPVSF